MEVVDKSVLEQYAKTNPALGFAIKPLEQLDIHQMSATLNLLKNGDILVKAKIQGENTQQPSPLHLNYNHEENLFDLMASIRLSDSFQKRIENLLKNSKNEELKMKYHYQLEILCVLLCSLYLLGACTPYSKFGCTKRADYY